MTTTVSGGVELCLETDLPAVFPDLVRVMAATRRTPPEVRRFEWLYQENPAGDALVWTIRDGESGSVVGFTACLPRQMRQGEKPLSAWIGSDFSVLPSHRSLGPAVTLRRAAKDALDGCEADLLYSHPNDRMAVIHKRVGHERIGEMRRFAKALAYAPPVRERFGRAASWLASVFDGARRLTTRIPFGNDMSLCDATFSDEYSELFGRTVPPDRLVGVRDAAHLNWRYRDNPLRDYQTIELREGDRLAGYLIFHVEEDCLLIDDVWPAAERIVAGQLLSAAARHGLRGGVRSIGHTLLEESPLTETLEAVGFRRRAETSQMFGYRPAGELPAAGGWLIGVGDRDV